MVSTSRARSPSASSASLRAIIRRILPRASRVEYSLGRIHVIGMTTHRLATNPIAADPDR